MFGKRYPNCVKKEEVEIEEKKMVKVKLNPEKKIGVKVTDIGILVVKRLSERIQWMKEQRL